MVGKLLIGYRGSGTLARLRLEGIPAKRPPNLGNSKNPSVKGAATLTLGVDF
jgi:hypothetical protein